MTRAGGARPTLQPVAIGRRALLLGGAACALEAAGARLPVTESVGHGAAPTLTRNERFAVQPDGIFAVRTSRPMVALTFDDGPDPAYTANVLDVLASFGAHATFFVVGANAAAAPDLVRQCAAAGHEIANHTQHHPDLDRLSDKGVATEIRLAQRSIAATRVPAPALFRPPKGRTSRTVAVEARRRGLRTAFWTQCVEHYLHVVGRRGPARLAADVRPGGIVLAHDGGTIVGSHLRPIDRSRTLAGLPDLLRGLRERGLEPVALATLLGEGRERHPG